MPPKLDDLSPKGIQPPAMGAAPGEGITKPPSDFSMPTLEPAKPDFGPPALHQASAPGPQQSNTELQLVSAKLDTIKLLIENMSARLARLEQMAEEANKESEVVTPRRSSPHVRWEY